MGNWDRLPVRIGIWLQFSDGKLGSIARFVTLTFIHPFQYNVQYKTTLFPWLVHPLAALIDLKRTLAGKKWETSEAM